MNNTNTPLQGELLLATQLELVTTTTVAGTIYGISFTLFCLYVHALVPRLQDPDRKRQAKFMLVYSSVIMLCGLYNLVTNAWIVQDAYIMHANYARGPFVYEGTTWHTPVMIIGSTCRVVDDILTLAIQTKLWRVWVVWSSTRYAKLVTVLPVLCFLTFTGLTLRSLVLDMSSSPVASFAQLNVRTRIAEGVTLGVTTILSTVLISLFLFFKHWQQKKLFGKAQGSVGYMKIVAILIESYSLLSIWLLVMTSLNDNSDVVIFFGEAYPYINILAYLLVQYRVASGKSYESQREQSKISSLNWNNSNRATTQFEATSDAAGDDHQLSTKHGASDALPVASVA